VARHRRAPANRSGVATVTHAHADESWQVVTVPGAAARKTYRCPGCNQQIPPGTPHLVVWPTDCADGVEQRRHWHTPCWRRGRTVRRDMRIDPSRWPAAVRTHPNPYICLERRNP
jgi:hypothetical protein